MPRRVTRAEAVASSVELASSGTGPVFVGVDGPGAAGKTTLAGLIAAAVPGCAVVHVDDFSGPRVPEWDWARLQRQVIDPLLAGEPARYQRWKWDRDEPGEWCTLEPGRPVVVEGVSSTRAELVVPWALTIWVDAPRSLRLRRAVERDGPAMLERWLSDWMPSEQAYIARQRPQDRVDLVVAGTE